MPTATVELRNVAGTEAALGWAAGHTVVVDRAEGTAGGLGLGFNGAQLLALAIGGCYCNDLRYAAHGLGVALGDIAVFVGVEMEGEPLIVREARMTVDCRTADGADATSVIDRALAVCTVRNSVERGFPVSVSRRDAGPTLAPETAA